MTEEGALRGRASVASVTVVASAAAATAVVAIIGTDAVGSCVGRAVATMTTGGLVGSTVGGGGTGLEIGSITGVVVSDTVDNGSITFVGVTVVGDDVVGSRVSDGTGSTITGDGVRGSIGASFIVGLTTNTAAAGEFVEIFLSSSCSSFLLIVDVAAGSVPADDVKMFDVVDDDVVGLKVGCGTGFTITGDGVGGLIGASFIVGLTTNAAAIGAFVVIFLSSSSLLIVVDVAAGSVLADDVKMFAVVDDDVVGSRVGDGT